MFSGKNTEAKVGLKRRGETREEEDNSVMHYHTHTDDTTYDRGPIVSVVGRAVVGARVVGAVLDGTEVEATAVVGAEVIGAEYSAHVTPSYSATTLSIQPRSPDTLE